MVCLLLLLITSTVTVDSIPNIWENSIARLHFVNRVFSSIRKEVRSNGKVLEVGFMSFNANDCVRANVPCHNWYFVDPEIRVLDSQFGHMIIGTLDSVNMSQSFTSIFDAGVVGWKPSTWPPNAVKSHVTAFKKLLKPSGSLYLTFDFRPPPDPSANHKYWIMVRTMLLNDFSPKKLFLEVTPRCSEDFKRSLVDLDAKLKYTEGKTINLNALPQSGLDNLGCEGYIHTEWTLLEKNVSSTPATTCPPDIEGSWAIGMMEGSHLNSLKLINSSPVIHCGIVSDIWASFTADPFLFFPNGSRGDWYALFEVKDVVLGRGVIGAAVSVDQGHNWRYLQIVLTEKHHLAYPYVFEHEGTIFMLPTSDTGVVNLYKSSHFPYHWEHVALLTNRPLIDASLLFHNKRWWMIGLFPTQSHEILQALYSESLLGPYRDTPFNCKDQNMTECAPNPADDNYKRHSRRRPGGSVFIGENGKVFRFVQSIRRSYGDRVDLYEVTSGLYPEMSIFNETLIHAFHNNFRSPRNVKLWNQKKYHHVSAIKIPADSSTQNARWVALVDGDYHF